jgi:uncharacterized damage-inducible protein DinB
MNNPSHKWFEWLKLCENLSSVEEEFIQLIDSLNTTLRDQKIAEGSWSTKDILAHIVGWEDEVLKQFKAFLVNPDVDDTYDIDSFNESSVSSRKNKTWNEIIEELKSAQEELSAFISTLSQKDIDAEDRFSEWVEVLIDHYKHHMFQLQKLT